jgi:uncharacterized protein (DUF1499 family)
MKYIFIIILLLAAFVSIRYFMPTLGTKAVAGVSKKEGQSFLADCPDTPNCQGSESSRQSQQVERFAVTKDPSQSIATLAKIVEGIKGMELVQFDERYLHATATTSLMQYVDDIEFLLSDDNQNIQVRSASRMGKADLGANAKRIELLRTASQNKI